MSPLKYQCIHCKTQWGNLEADDSNISHGVCRRCLRELQKDKVWRRQVREGYCDCYAKNHEDCTEYDCAFYISCKDSVIAEWEKQEGIYGRKEGRSKN